MVCPLTSELNQNITLWCVHSPYIAYIWIISDLMGQIALNYMFVTFDITSKKLCAYRRAHCPNRVFPHESREKVTSLQLD